MELKEEITMETDLAAITATPGLASEADYAYCWQVMNQASKRYAFASRFLPSDKRKHVTALYAFLRVGDDRVDVSHEGFATPEKGIDDWELSYRKAFAKGDSPHPVLRAYVNSAVQMGIPEDTMDAYFRAMRDDLTVKRYPTFTDLLYYMDGSAIPVGRAMTHILGVRPPYSMETAIAKADSLSIAMQLSNFLRDVGQDWHIGRVYLPQEDMERFEVSEADLAQQRVDSKFIELIEYEMARAEGYYQQARQGVAMLASGQWGVMCGLEIYGAILGDIRRIKYDVFHHRADPSRFERIRLVWHAWQAVLKLNKA